MAEQNPNGDWRTQGFRAKVINQIEEAVRQSATNMTKSSIEMENHVFDKAKSREEYLALVARLILHVRDIRNAQEKRAQGMPPGAQVMQQKPMQDPINALQNLARQGMGNQNAPGMSANAQTQLLQQRRQLNLMEQQQMIQQQRMATSQQRPPLQRQDAFIVTTAQHVQPVTQPLPASATGGNNISFQQPPPATGGMQRQVVSTQGMMGAQQQFSQANIQQVGTQQPVPSPVQNICSQTTSSPMTMIASSPQNTVVPSPASRTMVGVASPNSSLNLNTPGNPASMGMTASPAARSTDEQAYLDKLNKLSKYIQPLRRMINRLDKDEDHEKHKQDISKMKNLLAILTDPSKRLKMETLEKCEQALVKLELQQKSQTGGSASTTHMCQPLLDAVAGHIKSPMLNHTLQKTFGPAITALCGSQISAPGPPPKRLKMDDGHNEQELSNLLQGEIARLRSHFCIKLDPIHHTGSKIIHLHCRLDDKHLPTVPPILVTVPDNYPSGSPECCTVSKDYDSTPFLKCIQASLSTQLLKMPSSFSLTALLDTWEMSVRKACAMSL